MEIKNYYKATSLNDAHEVLNQHTNNAILGGGAWLKFSTQTIHTLIDLSQLKLNQIVETKNHIEIGAMTTLRDFEMSPLIKSIGCGFLSNAVSQIMGVGFRNVATIGSSMVGKFQFSDFITPLLTMTCHLVFYPEKKVTLQEFLDQKGRMTDILTHIIIEKELGKGYFKKVSNTVLDFSILNLAVYYHHDFKIAIGSRPGKALLANQAMDFINKEQTLSDEIIKETAQIAIDSMKFSSDERGSADYRKQLAYVYIQRGIKEVTNY